MADARLREFHDRVARIEAVARRRPGFEAQGALGRSHRPPPRRRAPGLGWVLGLLVVLALAGLTVKTAIVAILPPQEYAARLAALQQGSALDRAGAALMRPDPVTARLAAMFGG